MNTNTNYTPERCPDCPVQSGYVQKQVPTHKYGDWVLLSLSEESSRKLHQFTKETVIPTIQSSCPTLGCDSLRATDRDQFHLTIAMPLAPMNESTARELMTSLGGTGQIHHVIDLRTTFNFQASSPNYANGIAIGMEGNPEINGLAQKVRTFCKENSLVNSEQSSDGQLTSFSPHVSLGKIAGKENCQIIHRRREHNREVVNYQRNNPDLHYLIAKKGISASQTRSFDLVFDRIEIKRIDSDASVGQATITTLASRDLNSGQFQVYGENFISCSHGHDEDRSMNQMTAQFGNINLNPTSKVEGSHGSTESLAGKASADQSKSIQPHLAAAGLQKDVCRQLQRATGVTCSDNNVRIIPSYEKTSLEGLVIWSNKLKTADSIKGYLSKSGIEFRDITFEYSGMYRFFLNNEMSIKLCTILDTIH